MADFGRALLLRHGQTAWSRVGCHTGRTDLPLTPVGEEQARAAGRVLEGREFARCVVSPFARARRTADLAGLSGYDVDPDLAEWDYGPTEGLSTVEVRAELGYDWDIWAHGVDVPVAPGRAAERAAQDGAGPSPVPGVPHGETVEDVGRRARAVVSQIEPVLREGGDVLLVAHGHLLRVLTAVWLELDPMDGSRFALSTAAVSTLSYERDRHVLAGWNIQED